MTESDDLYLWNLVLFDQDLTGINRFLCLGPSREEREPPCPPESLSLRPFILGNEESSEDCPYPAVAGVGDCTFSSSPQPRPTEPRYKGRAGCPTAKVKPGAGLKQPEQRLG